MDTYISQVQEGMCTGRFYVTYCIKYKEKQCPMTCNYALSRLEKEVIKVKNDE